MSLTPPITTADASQQATLNLWNCLTCRRRKIRCDRRSPCSHCSKGGLECTFPVSGRIPTRRYNPSSSTGSNEKQIELLNRVRRLESMVEVLSSQHGGDTESQRDPLSADILPVVGVADFPGDPATKETYPDLLRGREEALSKVTQEFGRLMVAKNGSLYIGSHFWAAIFDEVKHLRWALEDNDNIDSESNEEPLIGCAASRPSISKGPDVRGVEDLQPLPSQIPYIWQIFVENVDPCIKVLHLPSTAKIIRDSKGKFSSLPPGMEALMFAISLAAITSLSDDEVIENFNDTKSKLIDQLTVGTEKAFSNAGVLNTSDFSVVQAITIYLDVIGERIGTRAVWSLAGLLMRTAISMGLHRDGTHFQDISPFEVEMRRRLWWHICFIDLCAGDAQVSEVSISESIFDTQEPTNLDDTDIDPDMAEAPAAREGVTDTTLCLLRCELWRLMRQIQCHLSVSHSRKDVLDSCAEEELNMLRISLKRIEDKFLRHLEPERPMHSFIAALARLSLTRVELLVNHKDEPYDRSDSDSSYDQKRNKSFLTSIASLHCVNLLQTSPTTLKWCWIFRGCVQWQAISILLVQLCKRPWGPTCERAWTSIKLVVNSIPEAARKEALRKPVWSLMADAQRHREREIRRIQEDPVVTRQLGLLARIEPSAFESSLFSSAQQATFDTSAAEEKLEVETAVSTGARVLEPLDSTGSEFISGIGTSAWHEMCFTEAGIAPFRADTSTMHSAAAWPSDPTTIPSAESHGTSIFAFSSALRDGDGFTSGSLFPDDLFNETNIIPRREDAEMGWLALNEMIGTSDVPW